MKVLSLFDGMACGMLAFQGCGIKVEQYDAYEVDKYAVKTATHNFPMIQEHGDVFDADFTQYEGVDFLIGGSPCTYWSIAQNANKRETTASGLGWELFSQYVRALKEAKPRYFIYENNKSMSDAIRNSISEAFGFDQVLINSSLVSAQNRQRYYWVGKRNADGSYSKVDVKQPIDRGIVLADILENGTDLTGNDKSYALTARYNGAVAWNTIERKQRNMVAEPIRIGCLPSADGTIKNGQAMRIYSTEGKAVTLKAQGGGLGAKTGLYAISCTDGKEHQVYDVKDGKMTIKGKQYPIKLEDGKYLVRKLTLEECKRLQGVHHQYEFPVSNTQAIKMLGNGWTVPVIEHLIKSCLEG